MKKWKLWLTLTLGLLITIVVLQNTETATTEILWITVEMPRVLLLVATLGVGFLIGLFTADRLHRRGKARSERGSPTPA